MKANLYRILHFYKMYRTLIWFLGFITTIGLPGIGYAMHVFSLIKERRQISADNPELATRQSISSPIDWLTDTTNTVAKIIFIAVLVGLALVAVLIVLQIITNSENKHQEQINTDSPVSDHYNDGYETTEDDESVHN